MIWKTTVNIYLAGLEGQWDTMVPIEGVTFDGDYATIYTSGKKGPFPAEATDRQDFPIREITKEQMSFLTHVYIDYTIVSFPIPITHGAYRCGDQTLIPMVGTKWFLDMGLYYRELKTTPIGKYPSYRVGNWTTKPIYFAVGNNPLV